MLGSLGSSIARGALARAGSAARLLSSASGGGGTDQNIEAAHALFKQGMTALTHRNFDAAFLSFAEAAEGGHVRAQNAAGGICLAQRGDVDGAKRFFRMAAEQGHLRGTVRLASLLSGTDVTAVEAAARLTAAVESGEADASVAAVAAALTAPPSAVELAEARALFAGAAARGDPEARLRVGVFLLAEGGNGLAEGVSWLTEAAGSPCEFGQEACVALGDIAREAGRKCAELGDAAREAKADAEAIRHYRRAAELAHGTAQYKLGAMMIMGKGGGNAAADREEAERWIFLASEQGEPMAQQTWVALHPEAADGGGEAAS